MTGLLLIGTGNDRRSAMAELLVRARLRQASLDLPVGSAGFDADAGAPLHPAARAALKRLGLPVGPFAARPLTTGMIADADLVLTAARAHREDVLTLRPEAAGKVFTVRELPLLLSGISAADLPDAPSRHRLQVMAELAAGRRRVMARPASTAVDVPVLAGRRLRAHQEAARVIDAAVSAIVGLVTPPDAPAVIDLRSTEFERQTRRAPWRMASAG